MGLLNLTIIDDVNALVLAVQAKQLVPSINAASKVLTDISGLASLVGYGATETEEHAKANDRAVKELGAACPDCIKSCKELATAKGAPVVGGVSPLLWTVIAQILEVVAAKYLNVVTDNSPVPPAPAPETGTVVV